MFGIKKIIYLFQELFLTFFFSWKVNIAPWTIGSFFSFLFILYLINYQNINFLCLLLIALIITIISIPIINYYEKRLKIHDSKHIVIDEFVWVAFTLAIIIYFTNNIYILILWLILFRVFDILKPWIIGIIDKKIKWWVWVMLDDIIAWLFAWILSIIIFLILKNLWILF